MRIPKDIREERSSVPSYPRPIWSDIIGATRWKGYANAVNEREGERERERERKRDKEHQRWRRKRRGEKEAKKGEKRFYENRSRWMCGRRLLEYGVHVGVIRSAFETHNDLIRRTA